MIETKRLYDPKRSRFGKLVIPYEITSDTSSPSKKDIGETP
jgi:hypothetical protein